MKPVRILIADDHEMVRQGLRRVVEQRPGWEICAEAADGREAVAKALEFRPDVAILDFTMPELNGLDAAIQILQLRPAPRVILLTMHQSDVLVNESLKAGVEGFILKTDAGKLLPQAVESVLEGRPFFTATVSRQVLDGYLRGAPAAGDASDTQLLMTPREREVVQLIAEGKSTKEVAAALGISVKTVETHRTHILGKLDAHSVTEIVRYAVRNGLIAP